MMLLMKHADCLAVVLTHGSTVKYSIQYSTVCMMQLMKYADCWAAVLTHDGGRSRQQ